VNPIHVVQDAGSYEHGDEPSGSIRSEECHDQLSEYQLFEKGADSLVNSWRFGKEKNEVH
jgi:hypothetical protein